MRCLDAGLAQLHGDAAEAVGLDFGLLSEPNRDRSLDVFDRHEELVVAGIDDAAGRSCGAPLRLRGVTSPS